MAYDLINPANLGLNEVAIAPAFTILRTTPIFSIDYVKVINIANNGNSTAVVSVHFVPSGGTPDNTNIILPSLRIKKKTVLQWCPEGAVTTAEGWTIQAQSSIAGVCICVSGGNGV